MSLTLEDNFQELGVLDCILAESIVVLGYILEKQANTFDHAPLAGALTRLIDKWRLLAGSVVWDTKTKTFGVRVPTGKLSEPRFKFTTTTYNDSIDSPTPTEASITSRPPLKYFFDSSTPSALSLYASLDHPILSVHVSHLNNATCIGFTFPHGIFDGTGMGLVLKGLNAELAGREWVPPPLTSHNQVTTAFAEMLKSPDLMGEPTPLAIRYEDYIKAFGLGALLKYLGSLGYEYMFYDNVTRNVFLDEGTVNRMVQEVKEQVKTYGNEKWVSAGDIIAAWFVKAALADDEDLDFSVGISISLRGALASTDPSFTNYPHNCVVSCPMAKLSSSWLRTATIAEIALKHREHVEEVRSPPFIQFAARRFSKIKSFPAIPVRHSQELSFLLSNQVVAGFTDIDFGPEAPVKGFWQWFQPIHPDHLGFINKFKGGYVIMAKMRTSRWSYVEKDIERIKSGESFT